MSDSPPRSPLPNWFDALAARAREVDGQPPFSDQSLVDARTGIRRLLAIDERAAALVTDAEAELVVDPDARRAGLGTALLERVLAETGPGLLVWAHGDSPGAQALAAQFGFEPVRRLLQLRSGLNSHPDTPSGLSSHSSTPSGLSSRSGASIETPEPVGEFSVRPRPATSIAPFRPGTDDAAWLALNARAFAAHAEQGSVSQADLDELTREPWFSADDFLLLWQAGELVGYCWLKVEGPVGELYVVGVDPAHQREGIGRTLVSAGLSRLRERGIRTAALYVEADNEPAVRLYESFGFVHYTVDVQYRR